MVTGAAFPWPNTAPRGARPQVDGPVTTTQGLDWIVHTTWWCHGLDRPRLIGLHLQQWTRGPWPADLPQLCAASAPVLAHVAARGPFESGLCAHCLGMLPLTVVVFGNRNSLSPGRQGAQCLGCKKHSTPAQPPTTGHALLRFEAAWMDAQKRLLDLPNADT
jgi:hypothetical protein